jgi:hypothetical protein
MAGDESVMALTTTEAPRVGCKVYHRALRAGDPAHYRSPTYQKSRCPGWANDPALQRRLLEEAIVDEAGGEDSFGRPKRLWNAVNGLYFVGVSTNESRPRYNCYPEVPTAYLDELDQRLERSLEDIRPGDTT